MDSPSCRLCGGQTEKKFDATVLGKYEINYFRCASCESLQTESPYWISEAYETNLSNLDTGAAQRNINNFAAVYLVSKLLNLTNVVDFGGGDGLLCRLLRDLNINCFVKDKYATPTYALGYVDPDFTKPDLVTGFEVVEHFSDPKIELNALFAQAPKAVLLSTGIYQGQDSDWWYLAKESGQHIFFYSPKAFGTLADQYSMRLVLCGEYVLFVRNDLASTFKLHLIKKLLRPKSIRWIRAMSVWLKPSGVWNDHVRQKAVVDSL